MLNFRLIKKETECDGGITLKRLFHASSYQGGILLRTTTIILDNKIKSIAETITNLPMAEIYKMENGKLDIRMMNFCMKQVGIDIGFDFTDPPDDDNDRGPDILTTSPVVKTGDKGPDMLTSECKE